MPKPKSWPNANRVPVRTPASSPCVLPDQTEPRSHLHLRAQHPGGQAWLRRRGKAGYESADKGTTMNTTATRNSAETWHWSMPSRYGPKRSCALSRAVRSGREYPEMLSSNEGTRLFGATWRSVWRPGPVGQGICAIVTKIRRSGWRLWHLQFAPDHGGRDRAQRHEDQKRHFCRAWPAAHFAAVWADRAERGLRLQPSAPWPGVKAIITSSIAARPGSPTVCTAMARCCWSRPTPSRASPQGMSL